MFFNPRQEQTKHAKLIKHSGIQEPVYHVENKSVTLRIICNSVG